MWVTKQLLVPSDFHSIFFLLWKSMGTSSNCLVTHILQNIFFYVQQKKEINTGMEQHYSE